MWEVLLIASFLLAPGDIPPVGENGGEMVRSAAIGRDARLLAVQGLAVLPDGTMLVSDRLDYRVKKFASTGEQRGAVGGRGKGPGLFQGPGPLDSYGNRIAVADFATGRVQLLRDLAPVSSFEIPGAVSDLCYDGAGNLWIMAVTLDRSRGLFLYGTDGKARKVFPLRNAEGDLFFDAGFVAWLGKGTIAVAYYLQNRVELWDTSGRFIREFAVAGFPDRAPTRPAQGNGPGMMVPEGNVFRSITSDGNGRLYLLGADYCAKPGQEVLELDRNGRLCRRMVLQEKSVLLRADRKGALYAVSADRRSVVRYRMKGG